MFLFWRGLRGLATSDDLCPPPTCLPGAAASAWSLSALVLQLHSIYFNLTWHLGSQICRYEQLVDREACPNNGLHLLRAKSDHKY